MAQQKFYHPNFESIPDVQNKELDGFLAIRIPTTMLDQLKQRAKQENSDVSTIIRKTLKQKLGGK